MRSSRWTAHRREHATAQRSAREDRRAARRRDARIALLVSRTSHGREHGWHSARRRRRSALVMGSDSDWDVMKHAAAQLDAFGDRRTRRACCRRTACPTRCSSTPKTRAPRGLRAIIAGAGGAAHLPGMLAAKTTVPVLGVPVPSKYLRGEDSLLSIVQMPAGIPVATFAIGEAGAANAGALRGRDARRHAMPRSRASSPRSALKQTDDRARDARSAGVRASARMTAARTRAAPRPSRLPPGAWLGLLGGGQLGRMFCMAAQSLGYRVAVLDPGDDSPAGSVADRHIAPTTSTRRRSPRCARCAAAATTEFENVPAAALEFLARELRVTPGAASVAIAQDRISEKTFLAGHGFAGRAVRRAAHARGRRRASTTRLLPGIVKSARFGYDGKGQVRVRDARRGRGGVRRDAWRVRACSSGMIDLAARSVGDRRARRRRQRRDVAGRREPASRRHPRRLDRCRRASTPRVAARGARDRHRRSPPRSTTAACCASSSSSRRGDALLVNEIAPRPHNSGHYTIDACVTSQFEQQARVLAALPMGDTRQHTPAVMLNLLGDIWFDAGGTTRARARLDARARAPAAKLHLYGKREPRRGRKMGHVTCLGATLDDALATRRDQARRSAFPQRPIATTRPPLAGIRVLDLTRLLPGPMCTLYLADLGADVIKVEDTGAGDYARALAPSAGEPRAPDSAMTAWYRAINRNKRSLAVDLKTRGGPRGVHRARAKRRRHRRRLPAGRRPFARRRLRRRCAPSIRESSIARCRATARPVRARSRPGTTSITSATRARSIDTGERGGAPALANLQIADLLGGAATARDRHPRRAARRAAQRRRPLRRRRDGRRRARAPDLRARALEDRGASRAARRRPADRRRALLRRLRDARSAVARRRRARGEILARAVRSARTRPTSSPAQFATGRRRRSAPAGSLAAIFAATHARRVVRAPRGRRLLRDAGADVRRGARRSAIRRARNGLHRPDGSRQYAPPFKLSPDAFVVTRDAPRQGEHTREVLREAGYDDARSTACSTRAWSRSLRDAARAGTRTARRNRNTRRRSRHVPSVSPALRDRGPHRSPARRRRARPMPRFRPACASNRRKGRSWRRCGTR